MSAQNKAIIYTDSGFIKTQIKFFSSDTTLVITESKTIRPINIKRIQEVVLYSKYDDMLISDFKKSGIQFKISKRSPESRFSEICFGLAGTCFGGGVLFMTKEYDIDTQGLTDEIDSDRKTARTLGVLGVVFSILGAIAG